jgi:hypothetical protein
MMSGRWVGGVASALAVLVLAAVPALGITRLGGEALSSWGAKEGSPGAISLAAGLSSPGPLTFEAPAATVRALKEEGQRSLARANPAQERVTDLKDWTYTAASADTIQLFENTILTEQAYQAYDVFIVQMGLQQGRSFDSIAQNLFIPLVFQLNLGATFGGLIPGASSLINLVDAEIALDIQYLRQGVPLTTLDELIFFQLTVNSAATTALLQIALAPPASPSS